MEKCSRDELFAVNPVWLRPKPDGSHRLIFSGEKLNKYFETQNMKLPSAMAPLYKMNKYACKIDFSNAYFHFKLEENFKNWFGFCVGEQHYRFNRMPFGWNVSPYLCSKLFWPFNRMIRAEAPTTTSDCYYDDILLTSNNFQQLKADT